MLTFLEEYELACDPYYTGRWNYLSVVAGLIKARALDPAPAGDSLDAQCTGHLQAHQVLELGAYKLPVVRGSHTMDIRPEINPSYLHNAKHIPWPITDGHYRLFVSCQALGHMGAPDSGEQERVFAEIRRVCAGPVVVTAPLSVASNRGLAQWYRPGRRHALGGASARCASGRAGVAPQAGVLVGPARRLSHENSRQLLRIPAAS